MSNVKSVPFVCLNWSESRMLQLFFPQFALHGLFHPTGKLISSTFGSYCWAYRSSWNLARSTSWAWRSVCQSGAFSLLWHIGHGLGRRQEEAQHGCEEDHTGAGESKEQVEDVPGQAGNAKGTKSLLGEETVNQSAHILIASGCCQHTLGQSKCQSNSQAKGKWHHGRRRLHAGFHLFNWCCHGCANLVTWSLTLSEGGWDKALNGWQSKDHQAASNHLGGKSHLALSADKRQLEHGHRLTGLAWAMRAGRGYKDKRHVIWF